MIIDDKTGKTSGPFTDDGLVKRYNYEPHVEAVLRNICDYAHVLPKYENEIRRQINAALDRHDAELKSQLLQTQDLLRRARRNVEHSASHQAGAASRELLKEIDVALADAKT